MVRQDDYDQMLSIAHALTFRAENSLSQPSGQRPTATSSVTNVVSACTTREMSRAAVQSHTVPDLQSKVHVLDRGSANLWILEWQVPFLQGERAHRPLRIDVNVGIEHVFKTYTCCDETREAAWR